MTPALQQPISYQRSTISQLLGWWQLTRQAPAGKINLLHTVPYNEEIYHKLLAIRSGDQVVTPIISGVITGREVDRIQAYNLTEKRDMGYWTDAGCNMLVVTGVEWIGK